MATFSLEVLNVAFTGAEQTWDVPAGTSRLKMKPEGCACTLAHESGGDIFTLSDGEVLEFDTPNLQGTTFYLNGTNGNDLEVILLKGLLN
jgi:hypothetical protein